MRALILLCACLTLVSLMAPSWADDIGTIGLDTTVNKLPQRLKDLGFRMEDIKVDGKVKKRVIFPSSAISTNGEKTLAEFSRKSPSSFTSKGNNIVFRLKEHPSTGQVYVLGVSDFGTSFVVNIDTKKNKISSKFSKDIGAKSISDKEINFYFRDSRKEKRDRGTKKDGKTPDYGFQIEDIIRPAKNSFISYLKLEYKVNPSDNNFKVSAVSALPTTEGFKKALITERAAGPKKDNYIPYFLYTDTFEGDYIPNADLKKAYDQVRFHEQSKVMKKNVRGNSYKIYPGRLSRQEQEDLARLEFLKRDKPELFIVPKTKSEKLNDLKQRLEEVDNKLTEIRARIRLFGGREGLPLDEQAALPKLEKQKNALENSIEKAATEADIDPKKIEEIKERVAMLNYLTDKQKRLQKRFEVRNIYGETVISPFDFELPEGMSVKVLEGKYLMIYREDGKAIPFDLRGSKEEGKGKTGTTSGFIVNISDLLDTADKDKNEKSFKKLGLCSVSAQPVEGGNPATYVGVAANIQDLIDSVVLPASREAGAEESTEKTFIRTGRSGAGFFGKSYKLKGEPGIWFKVYNSDKAGNPIKDQFIWVRMDRKKESVQGLFSEKEVDGGYWQVAECKPGCGWDCRTRFEVSADGEITMSRPDYDVKRDGPSIESRVNAGNRDRLKRKVNINSFLYTGKEVLRLEEK